jgi:hypothetical protein
MKLIEVIGMQDGCGAVSRPFGVGLIRRSQPGADYGEGSWACIDLMGDSCFCDFRYDNRKSPEWNPVSADQSASE